MSHGVSSPKYEPLVSHGDPLQGGKFREAFVNNKTALGQVYEGFVHWQNGFGASSGRQCQWQNWFGPLCL